MQTLLQPQFPIWPRPLLNAIADDWLMLRGIALIAFGVLALAWPAIELEALILLFGVFALVDGLLALVAAVVRDGDVASRWWLAAVGIAGVVVACLTFLWPNLSAMVLLYLIAAWAIATGAAEIVGAIRVRRELDNEWLLVVSGVVSVLFGIALAVQPGAGAIALVWIIGSYAIVSGVFHLMLALRIRQFQDTIRRRQERSEFR
jgi:uncharacterized membrane protein HdeD (DUF308 family)